VADGTTIIAVELLVLCVHNPIVRVLAQAKHVSPQQLLVRWALQLGVPVAKHESIA
jgi:hypothetical protein